jgi:hypothetical protein
VAEVIAAQARLPRSAGSARQEPHGQERDNS